MEKKLLDEINSRNKDGKIEVHKDAGFAENPMDREDITGVALNTGEKALILMASISRDHCGGSGQRLLQHPGRPQGDILPRPVQFYLALLHTSLSLHYNLYSI